MDDRTILLTGAAGRIGATLRSGWRGRFGVLRLLDRQLSGAAAAGEEVASVDLADFAAVRNVMKGVDVAVHLAAIPQEASFDRLLEANVRATYNVFEAARQSGVRRVVLASSYHVTGCYRRDQRIGPSAPARPDTI